VSGRYFTSTKTFVGQDLNDLSKVRTFQPNEYWVVWPDWTAKYNPDVPEGEEEFCEMTEEEFRKFEADPDAVQHVIISTEREPDYSELLRNDQLHSAVYGCSFEVCKKRKPMANRNECIHGKTREGARDDAFEADVVND